MTSEFEDGSNVGAGAEIVPVCGGITAARGMKASGVFAGIRKTKKDVAIIYSEVPAVAAGVYTQNKVKAAPVLVCMDRIGAGEIQAIVVISGNANACTGEPGLRDAYECTEVLAHELGIDPALVAMASTGVIGVRLPMDRVVPGIRDAAHSLSREGGHYAAEAIMTTDTFSKECAVRVRIGGRDVVVGGMAKGSGMIHPNMATMLAFISTDVAIDVGLLRQALGSAVARSFNSITVDGDTSTNDMAVVMANGLAGNEPITGQGEDYERFREALETVCMELAKMIARDGEGATKLVEVVVRNAGTEADARKVAMAIAKSPLVKTAIFGADANWGRIMCAAGYSGAEFDPDRVDIYIGPEKVAEDGMALPFSEVQAKAALLGADVRITVDLKDGCAEAKVWTCDLTFDYVKINASYRS